MQRLLDMIWQALQATGQAIADLLIALPLWSWGLILGSLLLLLLVSLWRGSGSKARARPEVMLSRAELAPDDVHDGYYRLVAAFSNMHYEPVQLLRIAVAGGDGRFQVVETTALVGPRRAVELEAVVPVSPGGSGRLDVYLYVPAAPTRAWRVRVPLVWEPWTKQFKASPLEQTLRPVRRMPDEGARSGGRGEDAGHDVTPPTRQGRLDFPDDF